ncbi:uncharacterized protein CCOS01_16955 [Colletotrichum costaricense]|uniref:Uncharacterized protein n=1 Tax=Colletotrichum costaricense TaxID=1209916 RepID=A0AAJ0DRI6_9PEZI|nr:uncharacterized protein CCOS01_16955 [Colletotrichum costaricense]KAK1503880.1 hypothetical protein CCOS01_16955 [Colletotrichum costaricense]
MASTDFTFFYGLKQQDSYERCAREVAKDVQDHVNMKDKPRSLLKPQSAGHDGYNPTDSDDLSAIKILTQMKNDDVRLPTTFDVDYGTLGSPLAGERWNPSGLAPSPDRHYELLQMSQNQLADLPSSELETKSVNGNGAMGPVDDLEVPHKTPSPSLGRIIYKEAETSEGLPIIPDPIGTDDTDRTRKKAHMLDGKIEPSQLLRGHLACIQHKFKKLEQKNTTLKKENASLDRLEVTRRGRDMQRWGWLPSIRRAAALAKNPRSTTVGDRELDLKHVGSTVPLQAPL